MMRRKRIYQAEASFTPGSADGGRVGLLGIQGRTGVDPTLSAPINYKSGPISSIGHSHSGSMDLNDASVVSGKRDVSLELSDGRGSSFSSEDSSTPMGSSKPRAASLDNRLLETPSTAGQSSYPSSPRHERRFGPAKLLSPNTLSVEAGVEEEPSPGLKTTRMSSPLSPIRGISYPPLSPKSLKRGFAIQPQFPRNPPLTVTRSQPEPPNITVIPDSQQEGEQSEQQQDGHHKRGRHDKERPDTRRYYTAGTIEDLKVGNTESH